MTTTMKPKFDEDLSKVIDTTINELEVYCQSKNIPALALTYAMLHQTFTVTMMYGFEKIASGEPNAKAPTERWMREFVTTALRQYLNNNPIPQDPIKH